MAGWRTTYGTLATGNEPLSYFDQSFNDVGLLTVVPCTAVTTSNVIALTPQGYTAAQSAYNNYQLYSFVADTTTSGDVTANVNSIGALNVYFSDGATQVARQAAYSRGILSHRLQFRIEPCWGLSRLITPVPGVVNTTAPTTQSFTSGTSQTYTTPAGVKWIKVRMVGGGGGGGGSGTG